MFGQHSDRHRIAAALAGLGNGQCGARMYRVDARRKEALMAALLAKGMAVTGSNPWDIDTKTSGVKLRAVWDPQASQLSVIVVSSAVYATCPKIWAKLDPVLSGAVAQGQRT